MAHEMAECEECGGEGVIDRETVGSRDRVDGLESIPCPVCHADEWPDDPTPGEEYEPMDELVKRRG